MTGYDIDLDLSVAREDEYFSSTTTVRFRCGDTGARTFVQLKPASLLEVCSTESRLIRSGLRATGILLPNLLGENGLIVRARMSYSKTGEGLHRFTDQAPITLTATTPPG